ncbi:immunoglobulin-like domain-containing protein [Bradyrhizobium diazoefficiens]|uniref:immunoglobulin-like domain-containing protein n=1 Tax=Bradyrhizobium diazoefficiens TaxID=1355477 RepID=UPI003517AE4E
MVVHLGYDQKVKLDFSAIANEKITLVHVGEKLIILFDNKSTITVDPVFDSRHDDQHLLSIELAPGRDVNVQEFASLFPITTDQSVLPAAGDGNGNAQGSGANFSNAAVDTLNAGNPLDLLGQEQLGNFVLNPETFAGLPATTLPSAGFTLSDTIVIHDETVDVQILNGANDQPSAGLPAVFSAVGLIGWAQSAVSEIASSSAGFGSGGTGTIAYALTTSTGAAFAGVDSGLQATVTGNEIFLFTEGNLVVGREGAGGVADPNGAVAFQLYLDPASLKLDVAQYEAIKHGTASAPDTSEGAQLGHVVFVQQTVTDGSGNTATALSTGSLGVSFLDDGPTILVTVADGSEGPTRLATLSLDESIASDRGANGFPDGTFDDVSGNTSPDPTGTHPIGTMKTDVGNVESPGDLAALFNVVKDGGTDTEKTTDYAYSFTLNAAGFSEESKGGIATTLKVTDPNHTYSDDTIYLFKVSDTEIVGHVGDDPNGPVAIRITLDNAGSLSGGQLVVDQYMAIDHGADLNNFDSTQFLNLVGEGASLGITLTATITDGDNDTATSSATIEIAGPQQSSIGFQDDGPSIDVTVHQPVEGSAHLATLSLDESIGGDRGANGLPDGTVDDVSGNTGPDPTGTNPIGELKTVAGEGELNGDLEALFDVTKIAGTDGEKSTDYAYSFALSGGKEAENGGIATTLKVTDPNHTYSDDTIYLFKVSDTEIVGHVGDDPNGPVAIRITLDNAGSLSGGQLVVDQYMAIDHGADLNNFDSTQFLNLVGEGASLGITLTATITDGDNDTATSSATIEIVGTEDSSISFQDDGPAVSVSANSTFQVVHDETLLLQSPPFGDDNDILFTPVFNGVSNPGHDPQVLFGLPIGYAQSNVAALTIDNVDFGTDGAAKTGAQLFSLTLTDAQGQSTTGPIDSNLATTEGKEIFLFLENGLIVGRYDGGDPGNDVTSTNDPAAFAIAIDPVNGKVSVVQYVSLHHNSADIGGDIDEAVSLAGALGQVKATVMVTDGDGDHASASANIGGGIQFEDDGPLVAATLSRNFGVTADETPGNQANDVTGPLQIFAGVQNPGVDPDEPGTPLAYATSSGAALSILPYFGVDGPDPAAAITYSLELKSSNSGVTLTDGTAISLSLDSAGRVIGTVGTDNVHPELSGTTAFAVAIDPLSGKVSVVEYLSLHHSDSSNPNDQVSLAAGSISAVVTIKDGDGDGDTASASADISSKIHFNDDGPALTIGTGVTTPELVALALNLDETIGHDGSPPDQYNLGEGESGGGVPNGTADDTGNATVTFTTDATSTAQIGELMTGAGLLAPLFTNAVIDYGADGPALVNPVTSALSLVLTGAPEAGGIKTNLVATALADSLLEGTSQEHRTVWLTIEGGQIVGRVGHDTLSTADDFVVLRISLNSTDPATAQLVVDQFLPIDHDASEPAGAQLPENPSLFDESISLLTAIAGQSVGVKLTVTVTDGDGDHVTKSATATVIDHSNSIVSIDDSGPTISASQDCVDTPLSYVGIKAGNVDERGLDGPSDQDVLMSGVGQGNSPNANTINTTGSDIGVGNQSIEGHEVHGGNDLAAEILRLDFVNNVTFPANTFAYNGHYEVDAASFTIHQIQGNPSNTATVFVQVFNANDNNDFTDDGNPLPITLNDVTVTGDASYTKIPVYDGNTLVGVVIVGLNEGATVTVDTSNDFNRLVISNYDNVAFSSTPNGAPTLPVDPNDSQELNVGHPFSVSGISSVVCAPATLSVTHDESAGFAPQSGPNPENDVDPATAPSVLTAAIAGAQIGTVLGYAESTGAANTLFTTPDFGTDGPGPAGGVSYQLTNSTGGGFTGQDSGLNTTVGNRDIFLFTDSANPNIVWGVDSNNLQTGEKVFALYVDTDGHLWVAQFAAIAHNVDGSTPAAYDDEVSITNGLVYISATATDGDGDTAHAVSPAGLHINFQDDGPHAFAEAPQDVLEGSAPVTGQLDFDPGADGATVTEINGVNLSFGVDGYSQAIALAHGSLQVTADGAYKFVAQPDDVYKTGGPANFTYTVTDGDGDTSASTVSFVVTDDSDPTKVTLNDVTVNEGVGTATISASVDHAPQGSNLVLTLSNGATITILNGQTTGTSTPFAVQGDDPYVDHETYPVSVTGATGGNYELLDTTDTSTVTVNDTITTNFVTLDNVVVFENQTFVYTAHMDYASLTSFTVTLNNGVNITFAPGQFTAMSAPQAAQGEDVYVDGQVIPVSIAGTSGGNFEAVNTTTYGNATVTFKDTIDPTKVTLNDVTVNEGVGTATISASVDHAPQGSNLVLTLSNGATITILNGQTTGTSTPFAVQGDDPYVDHETYPVSVTGATGGNYELLDTTDTATVTVNDTITTNFVTLDNVVVFENQTFVYTAHMDYASLTPFTVTLNNGVNITFAPGQFTATSDPQPAQGEDVYVDGQVIPVSIASTSGGNFEAVNTTTYGNATVTTKDTIDPVTATLSATPSTSEDGGSITYTVTLTSGLSPFTPTSNLDFTLANGEHVIVQAGQASGSTTIAVNEDDVYIDTHPVTNSIVSHTGGSEYESLVTNPATVTTTITDDSDPVTATLTATPSTSEDGGSITYTVTLTSGLSPFTPTGNLDFTLANGEHVIVQAGQASGSTTIAVNEDDVYIDTHPVTNSIVSHTGGSEYESLVTNPATVTTTITDDSDPVTATLTATPSTSEDGGSITYTVTLTSGLSPLTPTGNLDFTLANGEHVIVQAGQASGSTTIPVNEDDVYIDTHPVTNSIVSHTGGSEYESLVTNPATVTTTITDDSDPVTATLTATPSTSEDGGSITYTVTLTSGLSPFTPTGNLDFTLANGEHVIVQAGQASGSTTIPVNEDDVYIDTHPVTNSIVSHTGGSEYESLVTNPATVTTTITDDSDPVTATLTATPSTSEDGGSITYTVTLTSGLSPFTPTSNLDFTLANGEHVIVQAGQASGSTTIAVNEDDVYIDTHPVTNSIVSHTGGSEYESLVTNPATVTTTITDDSDPVTATLTATPSTSEDGGSITYTVTLTSGLSPLTPTSNLDFTLANGEHVIVQAGQASGSTTIAVNEDDVYIDTHPVTNSIVSHTGGSEYESLVTNPATVTTTITDDQDPVTATLTTSTAGISEFGGSVTYTVTLTSGLTPFTPKTDLVLTLANGEHVTIFAGQPSGSVTTNYTDAQITNQASIADSITGVFSGGGEYEQLLTTGTASVPVVYAPTVAVGNNVALPEDTQEVFQFTATPVSAGSHVTQVVVSGLTGWSVDTSTATVNGATVTATFNSGSGVLTFNISGAAAGTVETVSVAMTPPLNTDVDASITMTATAAQGAISATSAGTAGTIYVDAVADMPTVVAGQTHMIFVTDSPSDSNTAFSNGETGALQIKATFGDVHDGSESHTLDIHLQSGFTAGLLASGTIAGTYNGVATTFSYTYTSATGDIHIAVPQDTGLNPNANQTATIDLSFAVTAPATGTLPSTLNFTATATATETTLHGGGVGASNADLTTDNVAAFTDTTGIPAARLLSGTIVTNSNQTAQDMILTFVDQEHPLDAFSQLVITNAQGQQGNVTSDAGFNISGADHFLVSLDAPFDTSKIGVTNFTLNGTHIDEASGHPQIGISGGSVSAGFTAVMTTNNAAGVTGTDSHDSHTNNDSISDPSANTNTYNMTYVDGKSATASGSNDADLLNAAGSPGNVENGGAGNDILVYHPSTTIDGGSGFDILRIDDGAIYNSSLEISGASANGLSAGNAHTVGGVHLYGIDLSGANLTNLESILITDDPLASSLYGTELNGLSIAKVTAITEATNSTSATAHSLFVVGSAGDDVQLATGAGGWTESANTFTSTGGQVFHQWIPTGSTVATATASLFIDNDLQVNHAAQA